MSPAQHALAPGRALVSTQHTPHRRSPIRTADAWHAPAGLAGCRYIKSVVLGYRRDTVDTADTAENPLILGVGNDTAADTADTAQI